MYNIYCLQGFNNYYNRIVKKFDTIADYRTHYINANNPQGIQVFNKINFVPNDCVNTSQILNWKLNWIPDYIIAEDEDTGNFTRWFVMECIRQRGQQYQFTLRRDLIVDYFDTIIDEPTFIEKATLNSSDSFIFNDEAMTFNQIKTDETPLKDRSGCPWLVGYYTGLPNDLTDIVTDDLLKFDIDLDNYLYEDDPDTEDTITTWPYKKYFDNGKLNVADQNIFVSTFSGSYGGQSIFYTSAVGYNNRTDEFDEYAEIVLGSNDVVDYEKQLSQLVYEQNTGCKAGAKNYDFKEADNDDANVYLDFINPYKTTGFETINQKINTKFSSIGYSEFSTNILNLNNKVARFTTSGGEYVYYKFTVTKNSTPDPDATLQNYYGMNRKVIASEYTNQDDLYVTLQNIHQSTEYSTGSNPNNYFYTLVDYDSYILSAVQITDIKKYTIKAADWNDTKNILQDNPYKMFAIPYIEINNPDDSLTVINNTSEITVDRGVSYQIINKLITKLGSGENPFLKDVQLLPYCPVQELINEDGKIDISDDINKYYYLEIFSNTTPESVASYMFFPRNASFTFDITFQLSPSNVKIESQTDMYRLVSPNYNGQFEFNVARNGGITKFNVDCTYLPYNPYIHLNPDFHRLYGKKDFNDARGLICSGDFSITMLSDVWEAYQIQNKNYQQIFSREIQNMNVQHEVGRIQDITSAISGTLTGIAAGAFTGNLLGSGIAGGIAGGIMSGIGGAMDYQLNEKLRNEALDYKQDMFGYQLGNIKALPNSISKTTAYTYNNKIYPILEYYTCTDEEKEALAYKVAYNGMTVMRIGKIKDFINNYWSYKSISSQNYIKGKIIRIEDITCDDFHVATEISNEIFKGAYFPRLTNLKEK